MGGVPAAPGVSLRRLIINPDVRISMVFYSRKMCDDLVQNVQKRAIFLVDPYRLVLVHTVLIPGESCNHDHEKSLKKKPRPRSLSLIIISRKAIRDFIFITIKHNKNSLLGDNHALR